MVSSRPVVDTLITTSSTNNPSYRHALATARVKKKKEGKKEATDGPIKKTDL